MWANLPEGTVVVPTADGKNGGIRGECQCGSHDVTFYWFGPPALDSFMVGLTCHSCLATLTVSGLRSGLESMEVL